MMESQEQILKILKIIKERHENDERKIPDDSPNIPFARPVLVRQFGAVDYSVPRLCKIVLKHLANEAAGKYNEFVIVWRENLRSSITNSVHPKIIPELIQLIMDYEYMP